MKRTLTIEVNVVYDDTLTDTKKIAEALDKVVESALQSSGVLQQIGVEEVGFPNKGSGGGWN